MQGVRIEAVVTLGGGDIRFLYEVDVLCDCGKNGLADEATGESSFRHQIATGNGPDKLLVCACGKKYILHSQGTHIYVVS